MPHHGNETGWSCRAFLSDFTGRRSREEALRREAEELARFNADLQQFALTVAHDLHEPLRAVAGYLRMLNGLCKGKAGPEADEFLTPAEDRAARMRT